MTGLPLMVHIGDGPPTLDEVLSWMTRGDILTHCFANTSMSLWSADTKSPRNAAIEARKRGVLFDIGHGAGGFSFRVAEAMLRAGFPPDVISTDAHVRSVEGSMVNLPNCVSKLLAIGMGLDDALSAATLMPARAAHMDDIAGSLEVGRRGDVVIARLADGDFTFMDVEGEVRRSTVRLEIVTVIAGGAIIDRGVL